MRIDKAAAPPLPVVPLDVPAFTATPAVGTSARRARPGPGGSPPHCRRSSAVGCVCRLAGLNPAGARLARRRRSRAARTALRTLHALGRHPPADPAAVVCCVATYLAERYDLPGVFRTPAELARRLREAGARCGHDDRRVRGLPPRRRRGPVRPRPRT